MTTSPFTIHSNNPLENVLTLEDQYYREGYDLGLADGSHTGKLEGRATGLETGFEKFKQMGMLAGKTSVWAGRLARMDSATRTTSPAIPTTIDDDPKVLITHKKHGSKRSGSHRVRNHIETLHALSDAQTLSTVNDEDACTAFEDRLKRAMAKARVVENIMGDGRTLREKEKEKEKGEEKKEGHNFLGKTGDGRMKHTEGIKNVALREW